MIFQIEYQYTKLKIYFNTAHNNADAHAALLIRTFKFAKDLHCVMDVNCFGVVEVTFSVTTIKIFDQKLSLIVLHCSSFSLNHNERHIFSVL